MNLFSKMFGVLTCPANSMWECLVIFRVFFPGQKWLTDRAQKDVEVKILSESVNSMWEWLTDRAPKDVEVNILSESVNSMWEWLTNIL